MLCVQALDQAEGEYFAGTSIGFSLLYSDLDLKSYPCRFLFHNYYEQDLSSYGNWVDLDESKFTPLMVKRKRCNINPAISLGYSFSNENWYLGVFGEVSFGESCNYESLSDGLTLKSEISGFSGTFKLKGGYRNYIFRMKAI